MPEESVSASTVYNSLYRHGVDGKRRVQIPAKWRPGYFSAPHGVAFNAAGDLFVAEYTVHGRIHRFNVKK